VVVDVMTLGTLQGIFQYTARPSTLHWASDCRQTAHSASWTSKGAKPTCTE
jgi:hypothetical protein